MARWVHCPQCDQHYQFPDAAAGKQASCPKCGKALTVPAATPAPMPIPPAPELPPPPRPAPRSEEPLWALPVSQGGDRPPRKESSTPPPAVPLRPRVVDQTPAEDLPATVGDNPTAYFHAACGGSTTFSPDVAARITGDPFGFIPATYCAKCGRYVGLRAVVWQGTRENLAAYRARLRRSMHPGKILLRVLGGPLVGALLGAAVGALANLHNPRAVGLGILAGLLVGLPVGWFVTGVAFQLAWSMGQRKKANAGR
jgi:hypothetical protein